MSKKAEEARREVRRKSVAANLLAGLNYRQMADALGVSLGTIASDVRIIMGRWQREQVDDTEDYVALELRRLDMALNAIWDDVAEGKYGAIDRLLKIGERRARLLGLNRPTKVDFDWREEVENAGIDPDEIKAAVTEYLAGAIAGRAGSSDSGRPAGGARDSEGAG